MRGLYAWEDAAVELQRMKEAHKRGDGPAYVAAAARWEELLRESALTAKSRNSLPSSAFVYPEKRAYPIHDRAHASNALARSSGKPEEGTVKSKVCAKYPDLPACKRD